MPKKKRKVRKRYSLESLFVNPKVKGAEVRWKIKRIIYGIRYNPDAKNKYSPVVFLLRGDGNYYGHFVSQTVIDREHKVKALGVWRILTPKKYRLVIREGFFVPTTRKDMILRFV